MPSVAKLLVAVAIAVLAALLAVHGFRGFNAAGEAGGSSAAGGVEGGGSAPYLVLVGTTACPHCRAMMGFLPGLGLPLYFCEVYSDKECMHAFAVLAEQGIARGVPVIVACGSDGRLLFIEVGELRDATWWQLMLAQPPERPRVYWGRKLVAVLDSDVAGRLSELLCRSLLGHAQRLGG